MKRLFLISVWLLLAVSFRAHADITTQKTFTLSQGYFETPFQVEKEGPTQVLADASKAYINLVVFPEDVFKKNKDALMSGTYKEMPIKDLVAINFTGKKSLSAHLSTGRYIVWIDSGFIRPVGGDYEVTKKEQITVQISMP